MRVSKLRDETRSVAVKVEDETLTVEYRPNAYTPKLEQEAAQVSGDQAGPVLLTMLVPVIAGWDLVDDAGAMIPIDEANLAELPVSLLVTVLKAVGDDMNPQRASGTISGGI